MEGSASSKNISNNLRNGLENSNININSSTDISQKYKKEKNKSKDNIDNKIEKDSKENEDEEYYILLREKKKNNSIILHKKNLEKNSKKKRKNSEITKKDLDENNYTVEDIKPKEISKSTKSIKTIKKKVVFLPNFLTIIDVESYKKFNAENTSSEPFDNIGFFNPQSRFNNSNDDDGKAATLCSCCIF